MGSTEASGTALKMMYNTEGSQLLVLTAERSIVAFALPGWKRRVLVLPSSRYNMQNAHMALVPVGVAHITCAHAVRPVTCTVYIIYMTEAQLI